MAQTTRLRFAILGAGSWGTTVGSLLVRNAPAILWARNEATAKEINALHSNEKYLPGAQLNPALAATADLEQAVADADVVVMAVPSQGFRGVLEQARDAIRPWVPIISLSKGLEAGTGLRMTQITNQVAPGHPVGVLTGPNLAGEIMAGYAAAGVLAMEDDIILRELQSLFSSGLFRVYTNTDVVGCELGGVLKNVVAIAAGMADGQGAGENSRAALITRGLAEITRLGVALGGQAGTFAGLAGIGDLIATCTSTRSRNHSVGVELGRGRDIVEIEADMFMVAEGVKSAPVVVELARNLGVEMPIAEEVLKALTPGGGGRNAVRGLLRIAAGSESEPG